MAFRVGAYATVWETKDTQYKYREGRITTSRKIQTGWIDDFSGWVRFVGQANEKSKSLTRQDRIKILECEACQIYNKETKKTFNSYTIFDFEACKNKEVSNVANS